MNTIDQYQEFLNQHNNYSKFVRDCLKAYTTGWRGYPGIESIDFSDKGIDLTYSVWDDKENLHIPIEFVISGNVQSVVNLWKDEKEESDNQERENRKKEQEKIERAELARLQSKYS